ncbi:hypothetical protein VYU27_002685 [Nannochloropsis oceanica]
MNSAKESAQRQRRQQKLLIRVKLEDPWQQEVAIKGLLEEGNIDVLFPLVATGSSSCDGSSKHVISIPDRQGSVRTRGGDDDDNDDAEFGRGTSSSLTLPTLAVASSVCHGLEKLVRRGKAEVGVIIKRILAVLEETLLCASFLPHEYQQQQVQSLLALYIRTLTQMMLDGVSQEYGGGNMDAALLWCEQTPLVLALGFDQVRITPLVLAEASYFEAQKLPAHPEVSLVALQAPLLVAGLLEAQSCESKAVFVEALGTMPLDYIPQSALVALASCYLELLNFLPWPALAFSRGNKRLSPASSSTIGSGGLSGSSAAKDAQLVVQFTKIVFHLVCHLEAPRYVRIVGRRLAHHLVKLALHVVVQGSTAVLSMSMLLPLIVMLERLAEHDAILLAPDFPLLSYVLVAMGKAGVCGRERNTLLAVLQAIVNGNNDREGGDLSCFTSHALRWGLYPLISLISVSDAAAPLIAVVERRLQLAPSSVPLSDSGPGRSLRTLLMQPPTSFSQQSVASLVNSLKEAPDDDPVTMWQREWALFLVMGLFFNEDTVQESDEVTIAEDAQGLLDALVAQDKKGFVGARLIPAVLYRLDRCGKTINLISGAALVKTMMPVVRLQSRVLRFLPALGSHGVGAQLVQAFLKRLASTPAVVEASKAAHVSKGVSQLQDRAGICMVNLNTAVLSLSAALYRSNTRTFSGLRVLVLAAEADVTSSAVASGNLSGEEGEIRLARVLAISDVVREDPEAGSEFIGLLQTYLMDAHLPGVVATAVDCITYLCSADCLNYMAATRILQKEGRVQFKEHPLVLANLADFFGAGAYIFDCSPQIDIESEKEGGENSGGAYMKYGSNEDEERRPHIRKHHLANLTDNLWLLAQQPSAVVRRQAYLALAAYVPALLASEEEEVALGLRRRIFRALQEDGDVRARGGLINLLRSALLFETEDSGTWRHTLLRTGDSGADASQGTVNAAATALAATIGARPSRKTLKSLPTAEEILSLYQTHHGDVPGLAGATLHALGRKWRLTSSTSTTMGPSNMVDVFVDVLSDDDGGGRCVVQRLLAPHSFLRFLPALIQDRAASRPESLSGTLEAAEEVEAIIQSTMDQHRKQGRDVNNCFLALAALVNALPPQLSYKTAEVVATLQAALMSDAATGISLDIPTVLVSLGLAGRCLGPADAECVVTLVREVFVEHTQTAFTARTDWGWCQWGALVGAGVLTDWVRKIHSPDATTFELLVIVIRNCLVTLQEQALHSNALASMLRGPTGFFSLEGLMQERGSENGASSSTRSATVSWLAIDVGEVVSSSSLSSCSSAIDSINNKELAVVGASWALAIMAPNLAHVGLKQSLLQLYHILRAAAQAGITTVNFPLGVVAALALKADLLDVREILALLEKLASQVGNVIPIDKSGEEVNKNDDDNGALVLGVAHLAVSIQDIVILPVCLMDGLKRRLVSLVKTLQSTGTGAASEKPQQQTRTLAACLSMYTILASGGPLLDIMGKEVGAGLSADRATAGLTIDLVEALRCGILQSPSQRQRCGAARVLGLLVALRDEKEDKGSERVPGGVHSGRGRGLGGGPLDASTFGLPCEGTLSRLVLAELLRLAAGAGDVDPADSNGFVVSTLGALMSCRVLKFEHKQMALILQIFVKMSQARLKRRQQQQQPLEVVEHAEISNDDLAVIRACVAFAVIMARRDATYVTWLYDFAVNSSSAVVDVVLNVLDDLVRLTPTTLQAHLLSVLWRKCLDQEETGTAALVRAVKLLTGLALGCEDNGASSTVAEAVWFLVTADVLPFLRRFSSLYLILDTASNIHLSEREDGAGSSHSPPFKFLDALARVLAAVGRIHAMPDRVKEHLEQALIPTRLSGSVSEMGGIILSVLLVEKGMLPVVQLNTLRLQLMGPRIAFQEALPADFCCSLIPWVVRPLWASRGMSLAAARREWILALLDYLTVEPTRSGPLVVLVFLFTGELSWLGMPGGLIQHEALPLLQVQMHNALARAEGVKHCTTESTVEDQLRTDVLKEGVAVIFSESDDAGPVVEWGVQVVLRAVKILQTISSVARQKNMLMEQLLQQQRYFDGKDIYSPYLCTYKLLITGFIAGAIQGGGTGLLRRLPPATKRFVAEWSVFMSMIDLEAKAI